MLIPRRMPLMTLGWQSWSILVIVLAMALLMLMFVALA
jgi:hypothetical protein